MFYRFKDRGDGKNKQGKTSKEAFVDHLNWCVDMLSGKIDHLYKNEEDRKFHKYNALGNLKIFYTNGQASNLEGEKAKNLNKKIRYILEYYKSKPIEEIDVPPNITK